MYESFLHTIKPRGIQRANTVVGSSMTEYILSGTAEEVIHEIGLPTETRQRKAQQGT